MPASMQAFAQVAQRFGGVNPGDEPEVEAFYQSGMQKLSPESLREAFALLIEASAIESETPEATLEPGQARVPHIAGRMSMDEYLGAVLAPPTGEGAASPDAWTTETVVIPTSDIDLTDPQMPVGEYFRYHPLAVRIRHPAGTEFSVEIVSADDRDLLQR